MLNDVILFSLSANKSLTLEVAKHLKAPIGKVEIEHFADGEVMVRSLESVRGKSVYVIQSTSNPVNERIMELLVFIDGLKSANARHVNVVIPYYGYSRQDRIARPGEPISAKLIAKLLDTVGVHRIITIDLHTPQIQGFFSCPADVISPISYFGKYYQEKLEKEHIPFSDVVIVSPDHGSSHRARDLATLIPGSSIAIVDKRRPAPNKAEVVNIVGDVKGKCCIIIDDIIDTGGTILAATSKLLEKEANHVFVAATHGIFSNNAIELFKESRVEDIVITNSVEKDVSGVNVISIANAIAEVIENTELGLPIRDDLLSYY